MSDRVVLTERTSGFGWKRVLALGLLLGAVAAVAYLDQAMAGDFDLTLLYVSIVLTAALLLPRWVAIAVSSAVAIVSVGIGGSSGLPLMVNGAARLVVYGYVACSPTSGNASGAGCFG